MPTFNFKNKQTGEMWEDRMSIAEMEAKLAADTNLDVIPGATLQVDPLRCGISKPENHSHMRDVMKEIRKKHPLNTIQSSWGY